MLPVDNGTRTGALVFPVDHCGWAIVLVLLPYDVQVVLNIAPGRGQLRRHRRFWI
jgi:hypothetical protein